MRVGEEGRIASAVPWLVISAYAGLREASAGPRLRHQALTGKWAPVSGEDSRFNHPLLSYCAGGSSGGGPGDMGAVPGGGGGGGR